MLQAGGVQEAVIDAPPANDVLRIAVSCVPLTPMLVALEELQVSGTLVMLFPAASMTVAVTLIEVPGGTLISVLPGLPLAVSEIDLTGQTVTGVAILFVLPALAVIVVIPGVTVVTCA